MNNFESNRKQKLINAHEFILTPVVYPKARKNYKTMSVYLWVMSVVQHVKYMSHLMLTFIIYSYIYYLKKV